MTARTGSETRLRAADWRERAACHRRRADELLAPHLQRRRSGAKHPVYDFLFTYYSGRPGLIRRWHPGYGVVLEGAAADSYLGRAGYVRDRGGVTVDPGYLRARRDTVTFIADLLRVIGSRPARYNCFGLHEWAMVYRTPRVRHSDVPLRLGPERTDAVVESMPLRCTHFDAFRFFTEPAADRNAERLTRASQIATEQPGCVHAGMDLYKWALKLGPLIESGLVLDCLELAVAARVLDMKASPYDLRPFGFEPIAIETPSGRGEYARAQEQISTRATPLRSRLLERCRALQDTATGE